MKKNILVTLSFGLVGLCVGCATPRYTKQGATQDQFMKDRYECLRQTQQRIESANYSYGGGNYNSTVMPSCSALASCLASRGYYQKKDGELVVPSGTGIRCSR